MPKSFTVRPTLFIVTACLMLLGVGCWRELVAYDQQLLDSKTAIANLANSLVRDAEATVEVADTMVAGIVVRLETDGTTQVALATLNEALPARVGAMTRLHSIIVVDAHGDWLATSLPKTGPNLSDRDYFRHGRDDPDRGPFIGKPVAGRVTGGWIVTVSRRFQSADGHFAGVVFATIEIADFVGHYASLELGPKSLITLFTTDGTLLARYPWDESSIGRNLLTATVFSALKEKSAGSYQTTSVLDGTKRFSGYRRSDRYPLVNVVSVSVDHVLSMWRVNAALHIGMMVVVIGAVGLLARHLVRQVKLLRKSEEFLDHASRLAGVGAWELDIASNVVIWSAETARIHGMHHDFKPTLEQAIDFYAPEARPVIAAAVRQCIVDGTDWDLELALIRADGQAIWVRAVGSAIRAESKPIRLVGAFQDITERVVKRLALQAANERTTLATNSGRIGIWDWDVTNDRMVWDKWMYRLYGMQPRDGVAAYDLWQRHLHPDDRVSAEQAVRDALDGTRNYQADFRVVWEDGSVRHIRGSGEVTRDAAGRPTRMLGANWDVTELAEQNRRLTQAQQEIIAAGEQYRLLADNSTDMIVVVDRHFVRRYVSPSARDLLRYEPEQMVGQAGDDILHPDDIERVVATFNGLLNGTRDRDRINYRLRHRDGHWVWMESVRRVLNYDDTGAPMEICCALRDITERVAAENMLHESEERFHLLLQSGGVTEALYMLDPTGMVESWNAGAERIKGYMPEEIIGRNFATFFTPEDVANAEPERVLKMARENGRFTTEAWRVRKDGTRFLAFIVIEAIYRADGTLRGFAKVARDITTLRIEEEQRAVIIEAAPNGMMIVDEVGVITLVNSRVEMIFDYPYGSLVGQPVEILVPEALHGALRSPFTIRVSSRCMAQGREFTGRKRDGSPVSIEVMLSPVTTPRGAIVVVSLFDITERLRQTAEQHDLETNARLAMENTNAALDRLARHLAQARDKAEQASRAKSRFLAGMSHELRTPLNGLLGYAQLLHTEGGLSDTQAARVDAMLGAGKHLLQMITCVLDLSEIEAEHVELQVVELDLRAVAEACMDLIRPAAEAKNLALSISAAPGTPRTLIADATRLRQILLNLLGNAAKFTSQGAITLHLRHSTDATALRIEVADTGPGITAEQRQRLFMDFERLETEETRAVEGAGLGLALSFRLAEVMGGRLGQDGIPGGGSLFWLELPLNAVATAISGLTLAPGGLDDASVLIPSRPLHILVADDVLMNRDIAAGFLRTGGHTVVCVEGGAEAITAVASTDFDLVLMDVRMPEMDGLEATRRIRALEGERGKLPILALTAQAFTEQVADCRKAGMDGHLAKPFDIDTLLTAVARTFAAGHVADEVPKVGRSTADSTVEPGATAVAAPAIDPEPPVLNPTTFERTAAVLKPEAVIEYLRTIMALGQTLLRMLDEPNALLHDGNALADAAHTLAGSAGMFGFERLAAKSRSFERALQPGTADAPILAEELRAAGYVTLKEIDKRICAAAL